MIPPSAWTPVGVEELEPAAYEVVRSQITTLDVAGPGAGKTELLAQRASFLLDTGTCPPPHRILAISFKRDAAKNIKERVERRSSEGCRRFDSYTLDAFAKSIVDRFLSGIPSDWRPLVGYEVMLKSMRNEEILEWFDRVGVPEGRAEIAFRSHSNDRLKAMFDRMAHGEILPYTEQNIPDVVKYWGLHWWQEQLRRPAGSPSLTFPMLNRLAAFLFRQNPKITTALRRTYQYVFLDEFQDTTAAQYDLVMAAFHGSPTILTAVGDSKQRIMLWAGAKHDVFEVFERDFAVTLNHLIRNYRSAPELVEMQRHIAEALEAGTPPATAARCDTHGTCAILEFRNPQNEAEHLADMIQQGLQEGKRPRDFCILVRQRTGEMIATLQETLQSRNIKLRDESVLQDLLAEPVTKFLVAILRLATRRRDPVAWGVLTSELADIVGQSDSDDSSMIEEQAVRLLQHAKTAISEGFGIRQILDGLVTEVGANSLRSCYRQYASGSYFDDVLRSVTDALNGSIERCGTMADALSDFIGENVVPAMTIHKSKGLEFNTVFFLGLEDSQWWGFRNQPEEETRGFFVAFSRAIEHVYFTFSDVRVERFGARRQQRGQIGSLYEILQRAGVPVTDLRT
jgi:superfamily I DNA/RNA helicase